MNSILSAAQTALQNDPNLTPEAALAAAISTGAGVVLSPEELTKKGESEIVTDFSKGAQEGTFTQDPRLTVQPGAQAQPTEAQPSTGYKIITVRQGETLSQIAARELGSASKFNELATLNSISDPNKIGVGQTLRIPVEQAPAPAPAAQAPTPAPQQPTVPSNYVIKSGDTLGAIAARNNTSVDALARLNNISDPNKIIAGKTLKLK